MPENGTVKPPATPRTFGIFIVLWILLMSFTQYALWRNSKTAGKSAPPAASAYAGPPAGIPNEEFNGPLEGSGVVMDISGAGIPGAVVIYSVSSFSGRNAGGYRIYRRGASSTVTSGPGGTFSISGQQGASLGIDSVEKAGYVPSERIHESFTRRPGSHGEGPTFHLLMLPAAGTPEIRTWERMSTLPSGATSFRFDLDSGDLSDTGNVVFRFNASPETSSSYGKFKLTHELLIEGVPTQSAEAPLAPPDGYEEHGKTYPAWSDRDAWDWSFYYRRGDRFGRLVIALSTPSSSGERRVWLRNYFNESGGRNTEPVPPTDEKTLKLNPQNYARVREDQLTRASMENRLEGIPLQELTRLLGPPDREEEGALVYLLIHGFETRQWTFTLQNGRVSHYVSKTLADE